MINCCKGYDRKDKHQLLCRVCKRLATAMPAGEAEVDLQRKVKNLCSNFWLHDKKLRRGHPFKSKQQLELYQYALKHSLVPDHAYDIRFLEHIRTDYVDYEEV